MTKKRVLVVGAHPDDEIIFFWPILFQHQLDIELLICSSDENNPERIRYRRRKEALLAVCRMIGIPVKCLPYNSEFYRLPSRTTEHGRGEIFKVVDDIRARVMGADVDAIVTHNAHGEYGHGDHRLVNNIVVESTSLPVWFTDIHVYANWPLGSKVEALSPKRGYVPSALLYETQMSGNQRKLYEQCERVYRHIGCWTWSQIPLTECKIYRTISSAESSMQRSGHDLRVSVGAVAQTSNLTPM